MATSCSVPDCGNVIHSRSVCKKHWQDRYSARADCHPDRPRKSRDGLCDTCYSRRRYQTDADYRATKRERYGELYSDKRKKAYRELAGEPDSYHCAYCGKQHVPKTRRASNRFCSRNCQDAHNKMLRRVGRSDAGGYDRQEIFVRDGWKCQLCMKAIHRRRRSPHPLSPSIDHIVPLDCGGTDGVENVQAAHLGCNIAKGVRAMGEQLRLVG